MTYDGHAYVYNVGKLLAGTMGATTCLASSSRKSCVAESHAPQESKPQCPSIFQASACFMVLNVPLGKIGSHGQNRLKE